MWWQERTGLPLPLGGNVVRRDLGPQTIRQISRLLDQPQVLGHLLDEEAIADAAAARHVKDRVGARAAVEDLLLDHIVERRRIADMTRPLLIEHPVGRLRRPEGLRACEILIVRAFEQCGRIAEPAQPLIEANRAQELLFG